MKARTVEERIQRLLGSVERRLENTETHMAQLIDMDQEESRAFGYMLGRNDELSSFRTALKWILRNQNNLGA